MTNMAMELALQAQGVAFCRAKVGDRYVLEQLHQRGWLIGGEASGQILCMDKHNTGDGIISALRGAGRPAHAQAGFGHGVRRLAALSANHD